MKTQIKLYEGLDVSELLGITKWEPPMPAELAGIAKGLFPSFLVRTDEERSQNLSDKWDELRTHTYYTTEKLDGSSATFYLRNGEFGVCSRNLELQDPGEFVAGDITCDDGVVRQKKENSFWKAAKSLGLKEKLESVGYNICIQGELIGEGIQNNPYKLKGQDVRFYNAYKIDSAEYLDFAEFQALMNQLGLVTVPVLDTAFTLPSTIDELLLFADGKSVLCPTAIREGLVLRTLDRKISFKAISNDFLLKEK